jgi:hypothetical protein
MNSASDLTPYGPHDSGILTASHQNGNPRTGAGSTEAATRSAKETKEGQASLVTEQLCVLVTRSLEDQDGSRKHNPEEGGTWRDLRCSADH